MQYMLTKERLSILAFLAFLFLHPIFFYYHYAVAIGLVPGSIVSLTRGLYGPISLLIVSFYLLGFFGILKVTNIQKIWITKLFIGYLIWAVGVTLFNLSFLQETYTESGALKLFKDCILQLANFALGSLLLIRNDKKTTAILFCFLVWDGCIGNGVF